MLETARPYRRVRGYVFSRGSQAGDKERWEKKYRYEAFCTHWTTENMRRSSVQGARAYLCSPPRKNEKYEGNLSIAKTEVSQMMTRRALTNNVMRRALFT